MTEQLPEPKGIPVLDIEAINWTTPIAIGFFDGNKYHEFVREGMLDDVVWRFLKFLSEKYMGYKIYAHYAAKYDNKFLLSSLCAHDEVVTPEAGLARLKWKKYNISFEDSYLLVPMSLKKMSKMFSSEVKGEWNHKKTLNPWEMGEQLNAFKMYLKKDCLSLSKSLYVVCESLGYNFGVMPSISLSTTSAKVFDKRYYSVEDIAPNEEFEEFIRRAIYGGRNEVYRRYGENINHYDIRLNYVSCYNVDVPIGKMMWVKPNIDVGTLADAKVKVPKGLYIGPLPYKINNRLTFPTGEFRSWWDTRELKNAAENFGVDVSIVRQLRCIEEPIMKEFGEKVAVLREGEKADFWKMFGLSLSGKFGQGRWRDSIKHITELEEDKTGFSPIDIDEQYFQTKEYQGPKSPYIRPAIAMRIRSEARRRHLNRLIEASKKGQIYYGDTDSILTSAELTTGEEAGTLAFLGKAERGYFIRQKLYALVKKGKLIQRSSGFSDLKLEEEDFKTLLKGDKIEVLDEVFTTYKGVIKTGEFELFNRPRQLRGDVRNNRKIIGEDTEPLHITRT